jgi:hypothetical protein
MPLPVPYREKNPGAEGWQDFIATDADLFKHFNSERQNIGVLLGEKSGGRVDIDLDCAEAIRLAPLFLPQTEAIFGRRSTRRSHWEYIAAGVKTQRFIDTDGKTTLLELRSTGAQTIFPGSTHKETGELIEWDVNGDPARIETSHLQSCLGKLAAACLLARHWPSPSSGEHGSRHYASLALAGGLIRAGWTETETVCFVEAVCIAAQDEETRARLQNVESTARRQALGGQTTGWPSLTECLGEKVVRRVREWLNLKNDPLHEEAESSPPAAWPELSENALYGLTGEIVRVIDPHTEADRAAVLVQTLAAFGNCIGRNAYFTAEADRHYLNLFAVLVGATSKGRKGTSWGQVRRLFERIDETWTANCVGAGLSSGEGLIWSVRDATEKKEPVREKGRVVEYQTVIADEGVEDKRAFILEAEFSSVLRVMAREGNTLSAIIRQAWDTGTLQVKTRNNPNRATGAHVTIIGHITRDELKRNLDETETANGFANRFLWACVRRNRLLPEGGALPDTELNPLITRLHEAFIFARGVGEMQRDAEARTLWHQVYADLSAGQPGLFGAVTSRAEAQTMRLACLYALLDCKAVVGRVHLEAALALWHYCEASARYIFGSATGDRIADELLLALQESGIGGLTRTQIRDLFNRRRGGAIDAALAVLSETGRARFETEQTGGRPVTRWFALRDCDKSNQSDKSISQSGSREPFVGNVAYVAEQSDEPEWVRGQADEILERAAIMEMEGGIAREEAERLAREWYAPVPF